MSDLTFTLPPELVEQVAQRAAALVLERQPAQTLSPFMTIAEAAEYLRCKRQRIDDLLSSGRLTRHKDGTRTLVSRAELAAYIGADCPSVATNGKSPHPAGDRGVTR